MSTRSLEDRIAELKRLRDAEVEAAKGGSTAQWLICKSRLNMFLEHNALGIIEAMLDAWSTREAEKLTNERP